MRKIINKKNLIKIALIIVFLLFLIYLGWVYSMSKTIVKTTYDIETSKISSDKKIAFISDIHLGTCFDAKKFNEYLKEIENENVDMLLIGGDFIDGNTTKKDLDEALIYLNEVKTKYGVFFIYGNHERNGIVPDIKRNFDVAYFDNELNKTNIKVLEDKAVVLDDILLIGRRDDFDEKKGIERIDVDKIINNISFDKEIDKEKDLSKLYSIVVNHHPKDFDVYEKLNIDLVLSGHTHGGQYITGKILSNVFKLNDLTYGFLKKGNTNFVVTSGLASWLLPIKPAEKSEYVIINLIKVK